MLVGFSALPYTSRSYRFSSCDTSDAVMKKKDVNGGFHTMLKFNFLHVCYISTLTLHGTSVSSIIGDSLLISE